MGSTLLTLKTAVLANIGKTGDTYAGVIAKTAINTIIQSIASRFEAPELFTIDTTSADTADGMKSYHLTTGWSLTRPRRIYSLLLEDTSNSRKLEYIPYAKYLKEHPYPESESEGKPEAYTMFGMYVIMAPIPDAAYDVHVWYTKWPLTLSSDTDECSFSYFDELIVTGATGIAFAAYEEIQTASKWTSMYNSLLKSMMGTQLVLPDANFSGEGYEYLGGNVSGGATPWLNPFVKES